MRGHRKPTPDYAGALRLFDEGKQYGLLHPDEFKSHAQVKQFAYKHVGQMTVRMDMFESYVFNYARGIESVVGPLT